MSNISLKKIPLNKIIKRTNYHKKNDYITELVMKGEHFFFPGLETVRFTDEINWEYEHHNSPDTYLLYLHSLDIVSYLCNYYEKHKKHDVLKKAKEILFQWMYYDSEVGINTSFAWYNHTVANRTLTTIYYLLLDDELTKDEEIMIGNYLIKYAEFLYEDENYIENNHGIMMDRALILATVVLEEHPSSLIWRDKALVRIKTAFSRDFSFKNVHLENSPDYHSMVIRLFKTTESFLNAFKLSLGKQFQSRMHSADGYFSHLVKPDRTLPMIGDTSKTKRMNVTKEYSPFLDVEAGIAILQSKKKTDPELSTWLSFVCGYGSRTHKHNDDLSINLFYGGHDVLIDSGKYNYNKKDPIRKYIISPQAHSTISVKDKKYPITDVNLSREKIKIIGFTSNKNYQMVKGINKSYKEIEIERTVLYFPDDIIIVLDKVTSDNDNTYTQTFNLSPDVSIKDIDSNKIHTEVGNEQIVFRQHLGMSSSVIHEGNKETPVAIISEEFGKVIETKQCCFIKQGSNKVFLTSIELGNRNNRLKSLYYDEENEVLMVKIDYKHFSIGL